MIIHLTGTAQDLKEDIPFLRRIVKIVNENDGVLARDWVETERHRLEQGVSNQDVDWQEVVDSNLEAINRADLVIIEATHNRFLQGYQIAMALQYKRPTLMLTRDPEDSHSYFGVKDRLLTTVHYQTEEDLDKIVKDFIRANTVSTKDLRFNMFIDRAIYNHLRTLSYETGKNRSEIIRELIYRDIKKHDDN